MTRHEWMKNPIGKRFARFIGRLEAHRRNVLALQDRCTLFDCSCCVDASHFQMNEIATSQFAVDGHVEQGQVTSRSGQLKPNTDSPNMRGKCLSFLAYDAAGFPSFFDGMTIGRFEADAAVPPSRSLHAAPLETFERLNNRRRIPDTAMTASVPQRSIGRLPRAGLQRTTAQTRGQRPAHSLDSKPINIKTAGVPYAREASRGQVNPLREYLSSRFESASTTSKALAGSEIAVDGGTSD